MKITIVMPVGGLSGGARVTATYAKHFVERGHEVHILWHRHPEPTWRQRISRFVSTSQPSRAKKRQRHFDPLAVTQSVAARSGSIQDSDVPDSDVVIATWWETAAPVAKLSPAKGAKLYFMQDYGAPGQEIDKLVPTWKMPFTFVTLTKSLADQIRTHNSEADVFVVPNAADPEDYLTTSRPWPERPRIGFMYRASPSKGIDVALKALSLAQRINELEVVAFGGSVDRSDWPVDVNYHVRPTDAEVRRIYASCTAWLFPSHLEGFGLPILEAMANRTPVIGTRAGAAPDLIRSGENGYLVDTGDAEAMAKAIDAITEAGPEVWGRMSQAAYETVSGYDWEMAAQRFEAALVSGQKKRMARRAG